MTPAAATRGRSRMIGIATFSTDRPGTLEAAFRDLPGVLATGPVGIGGTIALRVEFDPEAISYEQLLDRFWQLDEPGPGVRAGTRSAVVVHSSEQEELAHTARERRGLLLGRPVRAAVVRAGRFAGRL